jgi:hypothetical protein
MIKERFIAIEMDGETQLINLDCVKLVRILDKDVIFKFSEKEAAAFSEDLLGREEFKKLKDSFIGHVSVRAL